MKLFLGKPQHQRLNYFAFAIAENLYVKIKTKYLNYKVKIISFRSNKLVALDMSELQADHYQNSEPGSCVV